MTPQALLDHAASVGRFYLGSTPPNPPVGALALNTSGDIIAEAAHALTGGLHAETLLLNRLKEMGALPLTATLVVTLEPCHHRGRQPPCTEALLSSPVRHLVIGCTDPNPTVKGGGINFLRQNGFQIEHFPLHQACQALLSGFHEKMVFKKPWVTIKCARQKDLSMFPPKGKKTFTSPSQLTLAHQLRKKSDAILTGSGTILSDNPHFTVRLVDDYPEKKRILAILDRRRRVPKVYLDEAASRGFQVRLYEGLDEAFKDLEKEPLHDVLVEAGPTLLESLLRSDYWNMLVTLYEEPREKVDVSFNVRQGFYDTRSPEILSYFLPHSRLRAY